MTLSRRTAQLGSLAFAVLSLGAAPGCGVKADSSSKRVGVRHASDATATSSETGGTSADAAHTVVPGAPAAAPTPVASDAPQAPIDSADHVNVDDGLPIPGNSGAIAVFGQTAKSLNVAWAPAHDPQTADAELKYQVFYSTTANLDSLDHVLVNGTPAGPAAKNIQAFQINGLAPATAYWVSVVVTGATGAQNRYPQVSAASASAVADVCVKTLLPQSFSTVNAPFLQRPTGVPNEYAPWIDTHGSAPFGPKLVYDGLKAGDILAVTSISGTIFDGVAGTCKDGAGSQQAILENIPILQFTDANDKVRDPGVTTFGGFGAIPLRDFLTKPLTIPAGVTRAYVSYGDTRYSDNHAACSVTLQITTHVKC